MSITSYTTTRGAKRYRVKYREPGGAQRYKTFARKADAQDFERQIDDVKRGIRPKHSDMTLNDLMLKVREVRWEKKLASSTLKTYDTLWKVHITSHPISSMKIQTIADEPILLEAWAAARVAGGAGPQALRKTIVTLSSVLELAVKWRFINHNPARYLDKPSAKRRRVVKVLRDWEIEKLIELMPTEDDKRMVALMGYAGLRPGEALALEWADVGENTLVIDKAMKEGGNVGTTKTSQARAVQISESLRPFLEAPATERHGRCVQGVRDYRNWAKRTFRAIARDEELGLGSLRPYDLRHSYASALIQQGATVVEVAAQLGHSPQVCLSTYAHVFAEARVRVR